MRTCFVCSVNNEAIFKAIFRIKEDQLSFAKAIQVATQVEDDMKVPKDIIYGTSEKVMMFIKVNIRE